MIQFKKCCLCYDLRLGANIISVFGIVVSFLILLVGCMASHLYLVELMIMSIIFLLMFTSSISLAYGSSKKELRSVLAWLIIILIGIVCGIISIIGEIIASFLSSGETPNFSFSTFMAVTISVYIYFWLCIHSFYEELKAGKYRKDLNNSVLSA